MIQSCVTISLVPEARGGPFVFWDDLAEGCRQARELGFDAVEIFPRGARSIDANKLGKLLDEHGLKLAALGTGAGWLVHQLSLTAADPVARRRALEFIRETIDLAGRFGAATIIGSMQGRWTAATGETAAMGYLVESLHELGQHAGSLGGRLLYEPLNRYETNFANTVAAGQEILNRASSKHVALLADLFHMNIEEADVADALRAGGKQIGHVHFVDSNRHAAGYGHLDFEPIAAALREIEYDGYLSAEAFALPDPLSAARQTIATFVRLFRG